MSCLFSFFYSYSFALFHALLTVLVFADSSVSYDAPDKLYVEFKLIGTGYALLLLTAEYFASLYYYSFHLKRTLLYAQYSLISFLFRVSGQVFLATSICTGEKVFFF